MDVLYCGIQNAFRGIAHSERTISLRGVRDYELLSCALCCAFAVRVRSSENAQHADVVHVNDPRAKPRFASQKLAHFEIQNSTRWRGQAVRVRQVCSVHTFVHCGREFVGKRTSLQLKFEKSLKNI